MAELLQANWWLLVIAVLIGILVAWWILVASRKTTVEREDKPQEDTPAKRNQALIDAPPAAAATAAAPPISPPPLTAVPEAAKLLQDEPEPEAASAQEPASAPAPTPTASGDADDLTRIKGVGPKLEGLLHSMGFYHFWQVAEWGAAEVAWVDENLEGFKGRVSRDNWVEQAKLLASGGETEFSKKVDGGDVY